MFVKATDDIYLVPLVLPAAPNACQTLAVADHIVGDADAAQAGYTCINFVARPEHDDVGIRVLDLQDDLPRTGRGAPNHPRRSNSSAASQYLGVVPTGNAYA